MIHFVYGPDATLARQHARQIAQQADPGGENTSWLDGKETSLNGVLNAIGTVSFFGGGRVVVVSDVLPKASGEGASGAGKAGEMLAALVAGVPEGSTLVLLEPSLSGPPAALKPHADRITVKSGAPPRGRDLITWIQERAKDAEGKIDQRTAGFLASTLFPQTWERAPNNPRYDRPPDLGLLGTAIETLAMAAHPNAITEAEVRTFVAREPDQKIFRFLDAMLAGDLRTATQELETLERAGEDAGMVLAQALGQVELVTAIAAAGGRDTNMVAKELGGVTPGRVSALASAARQEALRGYRAAGVAAKVDRDLKTGKIRKPEDALRALITGLARNAEQPGRGW
ncbi:MAG: hypothetical protein QM692_13640 [Thermomicrobiales bacterium]